MQTVSEILDAIRTLPRPDRVRLAQELSSELYGEDSAGQLQQTGAADAAEFRMWLRDLLAKVPASPRLASEAFDRGCIYDD